VATAIAAITAITAAAMAMATGNAIDKLKKMRYNRLSDWQSIIFFRRNFSEQAAMQDRLERDL
jgi:hypothetical protein